MNMTYDFKQLADNLLADSSRLLFIWLPGGKIVDREYCCSDIYGGKGQSFRVNIDRGVWCDFADSENQKGSDLISLYAAINSLSMGEAYLKLTNGVYDIPKNTLPKVKKPAPLDIVATPCLDGSLPLVKKGSDRWVYTDADYNPLLVVSRLSDGTAKKYSQSCHTKKGWVPKTMTNNRPLYNLPAIVSEQKSILIVEGEKAAEAAKKIGLSKYTITTWSGGSNAISRTDWTPLASRSILIWPDADSQKDKKTGILKSPKKQPGIAAALKIAGILHSLKCEVKWLNVSKTDYKDGFDCADVPAWRSTDFVKFAKPIVEPYVSILPASKPEPVLESVPDNDIPAIDPDQIIHPRGPQDDIPDPVSPSSNTAVVFASEENLPEYVKPSHMAAWIKMGIALNGQGNPHINEDNVFRVLSKYTGFKNLIWYDEFHAMYFTQWKSEKVREWTEFDDIELTMFVQNDLGMHRMKPDVIRRVVQIIGRRNKRNEPRDWINTLKWDGVNRLDSFLPTYFGTKDTDYTQIVGRNWFTALAARIMSPGCKFDNMLILEGAQGLQKSTALSVLAGDWYSELSISMQNKDFEQLLQGKIIHELGELASFSATDVDKAKSMLSKTEDRFRVPYAKTPETFKRAFVLVGTTNKGHYLHDETGARRFWPVKCLKIDIDKLREDRDQLFAEALQAFKGGETWWEVPESCFAEQDDRRNSDPWEDAIAVYVENRPHVTSAQIALNALGMADLERLSPGVGRRISSVMRVLDWERTRMKINGRNVHVYVNPVDVPELAMGQSELSGLPNSCVGHKERPDIY